MVRRTPSGGSGTHHRYVAQVELLKFQRRGQFPDELVKIEGAQIHYLGSQTYKEYQTLVKEIELGRLLL